MSYILIAAVIFVILFLVPMLLGVLQKLTKQQIIAVYSIIGAVLAVIGFFTYLQDSSNEKNLEVMKAFGRGETLRCREQAINSEEFNLVTGTQVFVGKKNSKMQDMVISVEDCIVEQ